MRIEDEIEKMSNWEYFWFACACVLTSTPMYSTGYSANDNKCPPRSAFRTPDDTKQDKLNFVLESKMED